MPRAGWLAVGAALAALALPAIGSSAVVAAVLCVAAALLVLAALLGRAAPAAVSAGVVLVAARLLIGGGGGPAAAEPALPEGPREWAATVVSAAAPRDGRQRVVVEATPIDAGAGDDAAAGLRLMLELPAAPAVRPSDALRFRTTVRAPPADGGYGSYLRRLGVAGTARATSFEHRSGAGPGVESLRQAAGDLLERHLPAPQSGLAAGILVGLRERVDRDLAAAFTTAGLSHVVAISGWNIAIVAGLVAATLRRLSSRWRAIGIIGAIAAYTVLAGASASVLRAALMAGVALLAREGGRPGRAGAALGLAALLMLAIDPGAVLDPGFQLSVLATAGLLRWSGPLQAWLDAHLPRAPGWVRESLAVSGAAQVATLPVVLLDFGRLSLVAPVANLFVAPFVAPAMAAGLAALLLAAAVEVGAPALLGLPGSVAGAAGFGVLVVVARAAAAVPGASLEPPPPWHLVAAGVAALLVGWAALGRRGPRTRRRDPASGQWSPHRRAAARPDAAATSPRTAAWPRAAALLLGLAALLLVAVALARPDGRLRMTMLDVGQGDALLLQGGAGGRILVDTGPDPQRLALLLDERLPAWDRRLDVVVFTHPHEDHVAGLTMLLERYRVGAVAGPGFAGPGPGYRAFEAAMRRRGLPIAALRAGDRLALDGAELRVVWPPPERPPPGPEAAGREINDGSVVLDVRFGQRRLLLTGDVEDDVDPALLAAGIAEQGTPLDVLKVSHHGSRTASTAPLLAALRPRLALISVGAENDYGHPSPDTLRRLAEVGARVLRTDRHGSVTVATDGRDLEVTVAGARPGRAPRRPQRSPAASGPDARTPPSMAGRGPAALTPIQSPGGRPLPRRGRGAPRLPRPARLVCHAHGGRGRRGSLPGGASPRARPPPRPGPGGGGGTAARRGQAAAGGGHRRAAAR